MQQSGHIPGIESTSGKPDYALQGSHRAISLAAVKIQGACALGRGHNVGKDTGTGNGMMGLSGPPLADT